MNNLQKYIKSKQLKVRGFTNMFIVKSTPNGVENIKSIPIIGFKIKENSTNYKLDTNEYPFEIEIKDNENHFEDVGYGSGFNCWEWTYFSTPYKKVADSYILTQFDYVKKHNTQIYRHPH